MRKYISIAQPLANSRAAHRAKEMRDSLCKLPAETIEEMLTVSHDPEQLAELQAELKRRDSKRLSADSTAREKREKNNFFFF